MKKKNQVTEVSGTDSVDHINVYSKGETELGRRASHFAYSPFVHPEFGAFDSMEGYWYYIKKLKDDDPQAEKLRTLSGFAAKEHGRTIASKHVPNFKELIISGNWHKFNQNPALKQLMVESTLPFDHYYVMGGGTVAVKPTGYEWLMDGLENIRKRLKLQVRTLSAVE